MHIDRYCSRPIGWLEVFELGEGSRWICFGLEPKIIRRTPTDRVGIRALIESLGRPGHAAIGDAALPRIIFPCLAMRQHCAKTDIGNLRTSHRHAERLHAAVAVRIVYGI